MKQPDSSWSKTVRLATPQDLPEVWRLFRDMHAEHALRPYNVQRVNEMFARHFMKQGAFLGVAGSEGKLKGMILLCVAYAWHADEPHLEELFCYVDPPARREPIARELLKFAQWTSDVAGPGTDGVNYHPMPLIISVLTNSQCEAKVRLYKRTFKKPPSGAAWVLNPTWKVHEPSNINPFAEPQRTRGGRKHKANRRSAEQLNGGAEHHG